MLLPVCLMFHIVESVPGLKRQVQIIYRCCSSAYVSESSYSFVGAVKQEDCSSFAMQFSMTVLRPYPRCARCNMKLVTSCRKLKV